MNTEAQIIDSLIDPVAISFTICWLSWVIFSTLRRYLTTKSQASIQKQIFAHIDSGDALLTLAGNDSGRLFLESLSLERPEPTSPHRRILNGIQAGVVLSTFGLALMYLHHVKVSDRAELLVLGTGAFSIGIGFLIAAAVSLWLARSLGLINHDSRG